MSLCDAFPHFLSLTLFLSRHAIDLNYIRFVVLVTPSLSKLFNKVHDRRRQ